jgi:hypothetical protein
VLVELLDLRRRGKAATLATAKAKLGEQRVEMIVANGHLIDLIDLNSQ